MSLSEKILKEKINKDTAVLTLLDIEDINGEKGYAYFAVLLEKFQEFKQAYTSGIINLDKYGMILDSGSGQPTKEIKNKIEKKYGFNHKEALPIQTA